MFTVSQKMTNHIHHDST